MSESLKPADMKTHVWGTFGIAGEHFGPNFMLVCHIVKFVANPAPLNIL